MYDGEIQKLNKKGIRNHCKCKIRPKRYRENGSMNPKFELNQLFINITKGCAKCHFCFSKALSGMSKTQKLSDIC